MGKKAEKLDASAVVLGNRYRDRIHGVEGVATSKHIYSSGCDRVTIEWLKDGDIKSYTFDVTDLIDVTTNAVVPNSGKPGGPRALPSAKSTG